MFIPKSLDRSVTDAARSLFADAWLVKPDDCRVPTAETPNGTFPRGDIGGKARVPRQWPPHSELFSLAHHTSLAKPSLTSNHSHTPPFGSLQKVQHKF